MPNWFEKVFECKENDPDRDKKIKLVTRGKKKFIKTKKYEYLVGDFIVDSLENIRKDAKRKALTYLQMKKNRLPFDNIFRVLLLENIEIMEEMNYLVNENACFQVASQTNCLEHPNKNEGPEKGITKYKDDHTQGPACAIAAAAGTYYRNYLCMPGDNGKPQTVDNQINTLSFLEEEIGNLDSKEYFSIQNGYVTITPIQRIQLKSLFDSPDYQESDGNYQRKIVDKISVGVMRETEVIIGGKLTSMKHFKYEPKIEKKFKVTQIFCSAVNLDVQENGSYPESTEYLAQAILTAQYEATLWIAVLNAINTGCNAVYLTLVGGGVFKNSTGMIKESIENAILEIQKIKFPLNVYIVHYNNVKDKNFYELEKLSYDFDRNKHIYFDDDMNEVDDDNLNISIKELYSKIDKNYTKLDKLTKKVNKRVKNSSGPITFSSKQVKPLKKCGQGLDKMIDTM